LIVQDITASRGVLPPSNSLPARIKHFSSLSVSRAPRPIGLILNSSPVSRSFRNTSFALLAGVICNSNPNSPVYPVCEMIQFTPAISIY